MSKKTSDNVLEYTLRSFSDIENDIISSYQDALKDIRAELLKLSEKDLLKNIDEVNINRYKKLESQIEKILIDIADKEYKLIDKYRQDIYNNAYDEYSAEIDIDLSKISKNFVKASLENPLYNANFASSMKNLSVSGLKDISSAITQGLIQGKSIVEISKLIKDAVNISAQRAITIARTELLRAMSQGQLESTKKIEATGLTVKKEWLYSYHIKDSRPHHEKMDGVEADDDGYFTLSNGVRMLAPRLSGDPAEDINCRCSYVNNIIEG